MTPRARRFLPKRTFKDTLTLGTGRDRITLYYFGRGHTNGDSWVVVPAARTMHTGDMFQRKNMPFVDVDNSRGSAVEFARTQGKRFPPRHQFRLQFSCGVSQAGAPVGRAFGRRLSL